MTVVMFWQLKIYTKNFDCMGYGTATPHVTQGSNIYSMLEVVYILWGLVSLSKPKITDYWGINIHSFKILLCITYISFNVKILGRYQWNT